jgi:hypothetical protein
MQERYQNLEFFSLLLIFYLLILGFVLHFYSCEQKMYIFKDVNTLFLYKKTFFQDTIFFVVIVEFIKHIFVLLFSKNFNFFFVITSDLKNKKLFKKRRLLFLRNLFVFLMNEKKFKCTHNCLFTLIFETNFFGGMNSSDVGKCCYFYNR